MPFTTETWRERAAVKLQDISRWLDQPRGRELPHAVYGTVAGLALWPLVEAVVQTGEFWPVVGAMYGLAGEAGSSLVAEQLQRWKDQADSPGEADVIAWAAQQAGNADVCQALDNILEELEAIAQAGLSAEDKTWFSKQLGRELADLGNLERFQAALVGTGAIAQGVGAKALGAGAVDAASHVEGSIITGHAEAGGDVVGRDKKIKAKTYIAQQTVVTEPAPDVTPLHQAYLNYVLAKADMLFLAGVDPKAIGEEAKAHLSLAAVYTALMTSGGDSHEAASLARGRGGRRLSALAQLDQHRRLVLLGDPGSGKSTFVNFVTACLAGERLGREDANLRLLTAPLPDEEGQPQAEPQPWQPGALLPLRVVLRDFAARGLPQSPDEAATAQHLWQFIEGELQTATLAEYGPHLQAELRRKGGLLLLDGLDEVPEADRRRVQIKQVVEDVAAAFPWVRILVTSRTYAYQKQAWQLPDFDVAVLDHFAPGQIRHFVDSWYTHLASVRGQHPDEAQGRAELLKRAIIASNRLQGLAERPLLLTLMASLHAWRGGNLPEKREELYADAVDLLLDTWEKPKIVPDSEGQPKVQQPSLAEWLNVDKERVRELLNQLAYEAHAGQPELKGTADIPESRLVTALLELSPDPNLRPKLLIEYLSHRAGLLLPHGVKVYTFPHRTFQEYLAACHLTDDDFPDKVAELARQEPDRWREVTLLAAAKASRGSSSNSWLLAEALCYEESHDDPTATWGAHLAAEVLVETANLVRISPRHQTKVARLQRWLVQIIRGQTLPPLERAIASANLAQLGDPRPEVLDVDAMPFCYIPAGPFFMGSDDVPQDEDEFWQEIFNSEKPQHEVNVAYHYWLGQYPVSNGHFEAFVAAGGYEEETYWPEAREAGVWQEGQVAGYAWIPEKGDYEQVTRPEPYDYGRPFNLANHPVAGITWYEALAFCRWLTEKWRRDEILPDSWVVQLPSEAEWEKAARGGLEIPGAPLIRPISRGSFEADLQLFANPRPRRLYPWGDEAAGPGRANYRDTDITSTSGLGCFPGGRSAYGCEEMSGNVFEWTRSLWGEWDFDKGAFKQVLVYPYQTNGEQEVLDRGVEWARVVRGGAWGADETWLRCADRNGNNPYGRNDDRGFRLVLSPIFLFRSGR